MKDYFVSDDNYIYINSLYAEGYISESLFQDAENENAIVREYGNGFECIGLFNMRFFDTENYDREKGKLETLFYPSIIETYPSENFKARLTINGVEDDFRVFRYEKGDILKSAVDSQNALYGEAFLNLLLSGKIPNTLNYDQILLLWNKNLAINGLNVNAPSVIKQMMIAKLYRQKDDMTKEFRLQAGTGKVKMTDYITANPRQIVSNSSVLAGLGFEDFADSLASSLLMTKRNQKQKRSPVEDIIFH